MGNKQFLAQMGVFLLLGVNVAAYCLFWPSEESAPSGAAKAGAAKKASSNESEEQEVAVFAGKKEQAAPPPASPESAAPISPPPLVEPPQAKLPPAGDSQRVLLDSLPYDAPKLIDPPPPLLILPSQEIDNVPLPADPSLAPIKPFVSKIPAQESQEVAAEDPIHRQLKQQVLLQQVQKPSEPLLALPLAPSTPSAEPMSAFDPGLAAKLRQSPWLLSMEVVGTQTQLIAQVRPKAGEQPEAQFKILCDRVEMKAPDGALQAVGKVTFVGIGLHGACRRLTLPFNEMRIVFEENVELTQTAKQPQATNQPEDAARAIPPDSVLRGEKIVWELRLPSRPGETKSETVRPANFDFPSPDTIVPPVLGNPR